MLAVGRSLRYGQAQPSASAFSLARDGQGGGADGRPTRRPLSPLATFTISSNEGIEGVGHIAGGILQACVHAIGDVVELV